MKATWMGNSTGVRFRLSLIVCIVACIMITGCTGKRQVKGLKRITITEQSLDSNLRIIQNIAPQLAELDDEFDNLPHPGNLGRDYFNAQEVDNIEGLLFRFLAIQTTL